MEADCQNARKSRGKNLNRLSKDYCNQIWISYFHDLILLNGATILGFFGPVLYSFVIFFIVGVCAKRNNDTKGFKNKRMATKVDNIHC